MPVNLLNPLAASAVAAFIILRVPSCLSCLRLFFPFNLARLFPFFLLSCLAGVRSLLAATVSLLLLVPAG